ncbi:MAG: hypothetical protein QXO75_00285 [Nitrososphaerota archaeon]
MAKHNPAGRINAFQDGLTSRQHTLLEDKLNGKKGIERLRSVNNFTEHLFNFGNYLRIFSVVSDA